MSETVAQYIIRRLEQEVSHAFCFVGGASIFLTDALNKSKIKAVFNLHEQACGIAAEAYGQLTNKLGFTIVTAGPGTLNILNPVAAAYIDSTPMIILSGQANSFHLSNNKLRNKGIQEVKTEQIVKSIVKKVYTITNPKDVQQIIEDAIFYAKDRRPGPIWIDIPLDIQNKEIPKDAGVSYYILPKFSPKYNLEDIINKLLSSKKPVILVGNGVRLSCAERNLYYILKKLRVPVLTTWRGMDLFTEDNLLFCGRPGAIGQLGANKTIQECDFLLCLGARLDLPSVAFNYENFAPKAKKIIVDIDEAEIDKLSFDKIKVVDTASNFLNTFNHYIESKNITYSVNDLIWLKDCKDRHNKFIEDIEHLSSGSELSLYKFIEELSPCCKDKIITVGSSGSINEVFCQVFQVPQGCRIIQSNGLGSMGFGIPAAIGAYYASGKPIICLDGDGSIALNMQELSLIEGANLPIGIFIINNGGYVSIKNTQDKLCDNRRFGTDENNGLYLPDYQHIADAFNLPYFRVTIRNYEYNICNMIKDFNRPFICEVFTEHNHITKYRTQTIKQSDGTLTMSKLEELY